jgi:hypothetical protein
MTSGPVEILIAERRVGSPQIEAAQGNAEKIDAPKRPRLTATVVRSTVGVRDGDRILGRTKLPDGPRKLLISSTRLGIMCLDEHGMNQRVISGPAVRVYSMSGRIRFKKTLAEIFTEKEIDRFETGSYGIFWFRDAWIDEVRKEVVIIAAEGREIQDVEFGLPDSQRVRVMDLKTGEVRLGGEDEILQAIINQNPTGLTAAIKLAAQMKINEAVPVLTSLYRTSTDKDLRKIIKSSLAEFGQRVD